MVVPPPRSLHGSRYHRASCWRRLLRQARLVGFITASLVGIAVVLLAKIPGVLLALLVVAILIFVSHHDPAERELSELRKSVRLSAEDIASTLREYQDYEASDAQQYAAAAGHPSPLIDPHSTHTDISRFHYLRRSSALFLHALPARVEEVHAERAGLEELLELTDSRATQLRESWDRARAAARRLGPGKNS